MKYTLQIRGKRNEWSFPIQAKPEYVEEWRADGLVVNELVNEVPQRIADVGLAGLWIWIEDLLRLT